MRARCVKPFCASANTATCGSIEYSEANICNKKAIECSHMAITIAEITDREQWDGFLTSQPRGHLLQSYDWGELNKYLGSRIYRVGALDQGRMVGGMLILVTQVPLPVKVPGVHFKWLYCCRGPSVERLDSLALAPLMEHAHKILTKENAGLLGLKQITTTDDQNLMACSEYISGFAFKT